MRSHHKIVLTNYVPHSALRKQGRLLRLLKRTRRDLSKSLKF